MERASAFFPLDAKTLDWTRLETLTRLAQQDAAALRDAAANRDTMNCGIHLTQLLIVLAKIRVAAGLANKPAGELVLDETYWNNFKADLETHLNRM
jgi:hypothetical protein